MLPSDGGICAQATGKRQVNYTFFQSWSHCFIVAYRVNMVQRLQHKPPLQTLYNFRAVPEVVYGSLPMMGKAVNLMCHLMC